MATPPTPNDNHGTDRDADRSDDPILLGLRPPTPEEIARFTDTLSGDDVLIAYEVKDVPRGDMTPVREALLASDLGELSGRVNEAWVKMFDRYRGDWWPDDPIYEDLVEDAERMIRAVAGHPSSELRAWAGALFSDTCDLMDEHTSRAGALDDEAFRAEMYSAVGR